MQITVQAEPKEIAALVSELQERQRIESEVCNTSNIGKIDGITVDLASHDITQAIRKHIIYTMQ